MFVDYNGQDNGCYTYYNPEHCEKQIDVSPPRSGQFYFVNEYESRKIWSAMACAIRNLPQFIWIDVKNVNKTDEKKEREIMIEKKIVIKLLIGFAFALKHYLREEEGNILEDNQKPNISSFNKKKKQPIIELKPNLHLEISLYISGYIKTQLRKKRIEPPITSNMLTIINLLNGQTRNRCYHKTLSPDDSHWVFDVENKNITIQSTEDEGMNNE
ncbi:24709_t:CDS:2, partial [Gigaspora margarita]